MLVMRNNKTSRLLALVTAALLMGQAATQTQAATIHYGNFNDIPPGTVVYTNVRESSSSDPVPPALYGQPSIFVNQLDFDPTGFGATSVGPIPGADITEGQLNFGFSTIPGKGLTGLKIQEAGDYTLFGVGTNATSASAGLFARIEITHVNFAPLAQSIIIVGSAQFSNFLLTSPGLNQPWSLELLVDFSAALTNAGFDPNTDLATRGEVVINNTMVATTEGNPSTVAQIAKKDFKLRPWVGDAVPEPGSVALLLIGASACLPRRRR